MDLCMLSLVERIIYHSLSHSVSCKKFPRVKLDIAVACEKKKKKFAGGELFISILEGHSQDERNRPDTLWVEQKPTRRSTFRPSHLRRGKPKRKSCSKGLHA